MSFKESVLIPLETYKRCRFDSSRKDLDILTSKTLSPDVKMKLYDQARLKLRKKPKQRPKSPDTIPVKDILNRIPLKDQPFVQSILDILQKHPTDISWNINHELILDGNLLPGTNISDIFQYLTKNITVTSDDDIPPGTRAFYDKLTFLNVPMSWIKQKLPVRSSIRKKAVRRKRQQSPFHPESDRLHQEPSKWTTWS